MSQVRKEEVDICMDDLEVIVNSCEEAGFEAKIINVKDSVFGYRYNKNTEDKVIQLTKHGVNTYGKPVIEIIRNKDKAEFVVDLHNNIAENKKKFDKVKNSVVSHYVKNKALISAKKLGFTVVSKKEYEKTIKIKVRHF